MRFPSYKPLAGYSELVISHLLLNSWTVDMSTHVKVTEWWTKSKQTIWFVEEMHCRNSVSRTEQMDTSIANVQHPPQIPLYCQLTALSLSPLLPPTCHHLITCSPGNCFCLWKAAPTLCHLLLMAWTLLQSRPSMKPTFKNNQKWPCGTMAQTQIILSRQISSVSSSV